MLNPVKAWYTIGSIKQIATGAGIVATRPIQRFSISLGQMANANQTVVTDMAECTKHAWQESYMVVLFASTQAARRFLDVIGRRNLHL